MRFVAILLLSLLLVCCAKPKSHADLQSMLSQALNTKVGDGFEILDFDSSSSIGDYVETYRVRFSSEEFSSIYNGAKSDPEWTKLPNQNRLEKNSSFNGYGFNGVIVTLDPQYNEVRVQFGWE